MHNFIPISANCLRRHDSSARDIPTLEPLILFLVYSHDNSVLRKSGTRLAGSSRPKYNSVTCLELPVHPRSERYHLLAYHSFLEALTPPLALFRSTSLSTYLDAVFRHPSLRVRVSANPGNNCVLSVTVPPKRRCRGEWIAFTKPIHAGNLF